MLAVKGVADLDGKALERVPGKVSERSLKGAHF